MYRPFKNVAVGSLIQPGGQQVGDIGFTANTELHCRPGQLSHKTLGYALDYQGFESFKG